MSGQCRAFASFETPASTPGILIVLSVTSFPKITGKETCVRRGRIWLNTFVICALVGFKCEIHYTLCIWNYWRG